MHLLNYCGEAQCYFAMLVLSAVTQNIHALFIKPTSCCSLPLLGFNSKTEFILFVQLFSFTGKTTVFFYYKKWNNWLVKIYFIGEFL